MLTSMIWSSWWEMCLSTLIHSFLNSFIHSFIIFYASWGSWHLFCALGYTSMPCYLFAAQTVPPLAFGSPLRWAYEVSKGWALKHPEDLGFA